MVVYEVNLYVDEEVAEAYAAWLEEHVQALLALEGFERADWYERPSETTGRVAWTLQYRLVDRAALERYFAEHASAMRGDGLARFGGRFEATRRVLTLRAAFSG